MRPVRLAVCILAVALACGGGSGGGFASSMGPAITSVSAGTDAGSTSTTASSTSGDISSTSGEASSTSAASAASTGTIYDLGGGGDIGPIAPPGCKDRIDFLFVMKRGLQLPEHQQKLLAAFPAFIDTIQDKFAGFDVHIMVVDTESWWGQQSCDPEGCLDTDNNGCQIGEHFVADYPCGVKATLGKCDKTLGAGTVFNAGLDSANVPCKLDGGHRYITQDQTDLKATFACMAQVGQGGGENVGQATAEAVSPALNQDGGCNAGFLRDDALLMITFVAPGGDDDSDGTPQDWADAVFAAKHGDKNAVVMLGIHGVAPDGGRGRLVEFLELFPFSLQGYLTEPSFGPIFADAVEMVDAACQGFTPPG
ncbi:MAG TPA: hypothetical protein VGB85_18380 [Nannocystis sp.]